MGSYLRIDKIGLSKLNNAEYTNFMKRTLGYAATATEEKIGADSALVKAMTANVEKLTDIVAQSTASVETARIHEADKQADELIVYLLGTFRTARTSPIQAQRTAAETLYVKTKPYVGCQNLPQNQQIQMMEGLLLDLRSETLAPHVTTLGLDAVVAELKKITARYAALVEQRAAAQMAGRLDTAKTVRAELDGQYDDLVTKAFAMSIVTPSAEATAFIASMNKLIADTSAAYNIRLAQLDKKKEG